MPNAGYANIGTGPFAYAIGWLDFPTVALAAGTSTIVSNTLADGSTITFTLSNTSVSGTPVSFGGVVPPTFSGAPFGNAAPTGGYLGLTSASVMYPTINTTYRSIISISNIVVKDPFGVTIPNYTMVATDGEATATTEGLIFQTDGSPWESIGNIGTGVSATYNNLGTTIVDAPGSGVTYHALILATNSPTNLDFTIYSPGGKEGITAGIILTHLEVNKIVNGRLSPTDQFNLSITGNTSTSTITYGLANGAQVVKASMYVTTDSISSSGFVINETMAPGSSSSLSDYYTTVNNYQLDQNAYPVAYPGYLGETLYPNYGQYILTTIVNTPITPLLDISKSVDKTTALPGDILTYTLTLVNTGSTSIYNVIITDTIPTGTTLVPNSITSTNPFTGTDLQMGLTLTDTVPPGGTNTLTFQVKVDKGIPPSNPLLNNWFAFYNYSLTLANAFVSLSTISNTVATTIPLQLDFGDAPDTSTITGPNNYNTLLANNGPRHVLYPGITLGTNITFEPDAYQNSTATGDDLSMGVQDDAILPTVPPIIINSNYSVDISYVNDTGLDANVYAWIDFNKDGVFQLNEAAAPVVVPSSSFNPRTVTLNFTTPPTSNLAAGDTTFLRLRITTDNLANTVNDLTFQDSRSIGLANDGEVEDYAITVASLGIQGNTWYDTNCNGLFDVGETIANGIPVELYSSSNLTTPIEFTTTNSSGFYNFTSLPAGDYYVKILSKDGYCYTYTNVGTNYNINSNVDKNTGFSGLISLDILTNPTTVNAGFCKCNSISGETFYDCNGNGQYDTDEPLLCGVTVNLLNSQGVQIASSITDCDGYYNFASLPASGYSLQFISPVGMYSTTQNSSLYYGSKPSTSTGIYTVTLTNTNYLQGYAGFTGNSTFYSTYCKDMATCNSSLATDCSKLNYPNTCSNCTGSCANCNNCSDNCLGCNGCNTTSNRDNGESCNNCNTNNCGCCKK